MQVLLVVSVILLLLYLGLMAIAVFLLARNLSRVSDETTRFLQETRTELVPAIKELRQVLSEADLLVGQVNDKIQRVDRVLNHIESVSDGRVLVTAASKALAGSKITVVSLLEGLKQGLRTLKGAGETKREETVYEQE